MERPQESRRPRWLGVGVAFAVLGPYLAIPMWFVFAPAGLIVGGTWILLMAAFLTWAAAGRLRGVGRGRVRPGEGGRLGAAQRPVELGAGFNEA